MAPSNTMKALQHFFDRHAAGWDAMVGVGHGERLRAMLTTLSIAPGARVVDVGCGTGVTFPILADCMDGCGQVVAVDVSRAMAQAARVRADGLAKLPACAVLQADVVIPPLRSESFDWVICNSCFPHFHDQARAVQVMAGLLAPGGCLVVCHTESRDAINALHRRVGGEVGGHELPDDDAMRQLIQTAGLRLIRFESTQEHYLLVAQK